jgi:hypothetical protein
MLIYALFLDHKKKRIVKKALLGRGFGFGSNRMWKAHSLQVNYVHCK